MSQGFSILFPLRRRLALRSKQAQTQMKAWPLERVMYFAADRYSRHLNYKMQFKNRGHCALPMPMLYPGITTTNK